MLTGLCNQEIHWLGLRVRVPEEWQIIRHSLSAARGQLVFVDRYRQRMQLNWVQCEREPDLDRMLEDDRAKQLQQHPDAELRRMADVSSWRGSQRSFENSGHVVTRVVRFDPATNRLLEASIIGTAGPDDADLVEEILTEAFVAAPATNATRWTAFDLDVDTPDPQWRLTGTNIVPADAAFIFTEVDPAKKDQPTGGVATVRRLGMADTWWQGEASARATLCKLGGTIHTVSKGEHRGRSAFVADGYEPGPRLKRVFGLLRQRRDVLWHCDRCNAVYLLSALSPQKRPVTPDAFVLRCGGPGGTCGDE